MGRALTRWLVVGAGRHADRFGLPALAESSSAEAAALCGSDEARVAGLAARHGVRRWSTSFAELLADPAITHVYVCSANARHERQVMRAAAAGKHVLCEKPLAADVTAARRMVDACASHGVVLGTGFHLRHNAANARARQFVADGGIGDPLWVRVDYLHALKEDDTARRLSASRLVGTPSAGAMAGTGAHAIDMARWLLGDEIAAVTAAMAETDPRGAFGPQRVVHVTGSAAGGAIVTVTAGRSRYPRNGVTVTGSRGHVTVTGSTGYHGGGVVRTVSDRGQQVVEVPSHDVYLDQFEAFAAATAGGGQASASGADGVAALGVADAVERSLAASGAPVAVGDLMFFEEGVS
ncbi:MAG TPA: Gfo/Idh/MocA family oxidoreductase [Trebonia sp.]|jgi:1,5-anhydro-D-fructose reductase (1,5-anhydro-D-mannitol-forming)